MAQAESEATRIAKTLPVKGGPVLDNLVTRHEVRQALLHLSGRLARDSVGSAVTEKNFLSKNLTFSCVRGTIKGRQARLHLLKRLARHSRAYSSFNREH